MNFKYNLVYILLIGVLKYCNGQNTFRRVCYFASWAQTRQNEDSRVQIADLDPHMCTHILYAFGIIDRDNLKILPMEWNDEPTEHGPGNYEKLTAMKKKNARLKIMISIGGAKAKSDGFTAITSSVENQKKFAQNAIKFLRKWQFDGADLDWEFPYDTLSLTQLCKELMSAFEQEAQNTGNRRLLLSVAVGVSEKLVTNSYNVPEMSRHVDFINIMGYDFHGSWDRFTGGNSPLFSRHHDRQFNHRNSLEWAVMRWIQAGAPKRKLVLGLPLQGRSFLLGDMTQTGVGAPSLGPGLPGKYIGESGSLAYYEICEFIGNGGQRRWDKVQKFPYTFKNNQWISYDNVRSIALKTTWMQERGLGGIMLWSIDLDDPFGEFCNQGNFPLTNTVRAVLEGKRIVDLGFVRSSGIRIHSYYLPGIMLKATLMLTCLIIWAQDIRF